MGTPVSGGLEIELRAEGLSKRFGRRTWALSDVDLAVHRGSITGLVGPNGAGKSTLMRTWMGFERPTRGAVRTAGLDPQRHRAAALRSVAYIPQSPALYRELTVADHLDFVSHYRAAPFDVAHTRRRLVDLGIRIDAPAATLSGGEAAQVGLALALGSRSRILILDEPLASLDPLARRDFIDVLRDDVGSSGATVVMSSHVVSDVELACDRLVVLGVGRMVLDEGIAEIRRTHWLASDAASGAARVGPAHGTDGQTVVRSDDLPEPGATAASLEDIVLAYLAAARNAVSA